MDDEDPEFRPPWSEVEVFAASIPKNETFPNEDAFSFSPDNRVFALSDGASVSFDPRTFAETICQRFVEKPIVDREWITELASTVQSSYSRENLPWMKLAALERGSFASLLGIEFCPEDELIRLTAVGDSNCIVLVNGEIVSRFPLEHAEQFDRSPDLLSTNESENGFLTDDRLKEARLDVQVAEADFLVVVAATDALAKWLIEHATPEDMVTICSFRDQAEFAHFVEETRKKGVLKLDDTTLLLLRTSRELSSNH